MGILLKIGRWNLANCFKTGISKIYSQFATKKKHFCYKTFFKRKWINRFFFSLFCPENTAPLNDRERKLVGALRFFPIPGNNIYIWNSQNTNFFLDLTWNIQSPVKLLVRPSCLVVCPNYLFFSRTYWKYPNSDESFVTFNSNGSLPP